MINEYLLSKLSNEKVNNLFMSVNPAEIPHEFIILARITSLTGKTIVFTGDEFKQFREQNPNITGTIEVAIDIEKFVEDVRTKTLEIFNK